MYRTILCAVAGAVIFVMPTKADDLPKEGKFDVTSCYTVTTNDIAFSKTHTATTYEIIGTGISNPPGGMFDQQSFRCVGLNSVIDGKFSATTFCEGVDKDGDKILTRLIVGLAEGVGQDDTHVGETVVIAGTGKYEGMTRTGTNENYPIRSAKPGISQRCGRATGTYKLK
jgi:hypothetical protein